jgi:hypothetical protein
MAAEARAQMQRQARSQAQVVEARPVKNSFLNQKVRCCYQSHPKVRPGAQPRSPALHNLPGSSQEPCDCLHQQTCTKCNTLACAGAEAEALSRLDAHLAAMWRAAPPNTLFIVAGLGGNTRYAKWLFEERAKRQRGGGGGGNVATGGAGGDGGAPRPWTLPCEEAWARLGERAVQGCLWLAVKP